jgi:hypothetical protein
MDLARTSAIVLIKAFADTTGVALAARCDRRPGTVI